MWCYVVFVKNKIYEIYSNEKMAKKCVENLKLERDGFDAHYEKYQLCKR